MNLVGAGEPEQVNGPDEDQHGRNHVAVLDYGYWQRRFGADPKVIGRTLVLNEKPWVVVGVMPAE